MNLNRPTIPQPILALLAALPLCLTLTACAAPTPTPPMATLPPPTTPAPTATPQPPAPTPSAATAAPALQIGALAPDFTFTLFHGEDELGASTLKLSDLRGKPLTLNFWARLCTPCWSEMPELQDFYQERRQQIQLLGIDIGQFTGLGSHKDAGKLLESLGITYPAGYTDDPAVVRRYQVRAMPSTIFIDADGRVFRIWTGAINRQQLDSIVAQLLPGGERKS